MYNQNNILAKVIRGELPSDKVYEDDKILAVKDIAPAAPIHILVIPKGEYISYDDFVQNASVDDVAHFFKTTQKIAKDLNVIDDGYRVIANHGKNAVQTIPHFHFHILAGKPLGPILSDGKNRTQEGD